MSIKPSGTPTDEIMPNQISIILLYYTNLVINKLVKFSFGITIITNKQTC